MKEIDLPSGAKLKISQTPFAVSKALYQAVLEEIKSVSFKSTGDKGDLLKDILCVGFSSRKIEACLNECFKFCLYGEMKIDKDTFEPMQAREDYSAVCVEVMKENLSPFMKGLSVELKRLDSVIINLLT